jgi:hypothetical protein
MQLYPEHLHHLVAEVIYRLHGNAAFGRLLERARRIAVERRPGFGIDFRL